MNLQQIKDRLESEEYEFLKNDRRLGENIILLTTGGSYAYGTNIDTSDLDIRGIFLNTKEEILTMKCYDKPFENKITDTVVYPLKQICTLLTKCNPNCLELMGTKDEHLFVCTEEGKMLRDNINVFLSQTVIHSFGGYATAQLRRLQNSLARDNYPQAEKEKHILDSIKNQMHSFEDRYKNICRDIQLKLGDSNKEDFQKEIMIDIDLKSYPLRDLKGMYSEMSNVIRDYDKLNHRNKKKDSLHLNKHAMHLIRILIMGSEILKGEGINTYRDKEHDLLMDIRHGKYVKENNGEADYSEVFEIVDKYEKDFEYAKKHCVLPEKPDLYKINELIMEINKKVVNLI